MILTTNKNAETISSGVLREGTMSIDQSDEHKMMMLLSEGLYKDKIGSVIREWTSNAIDSHVEAKVDDPVVVTIEEKMGSYWFRVQDFGMGISPDRKKNVVEKYLASTKTKSIDQLGAFGLGMKSGLSYADSFTYITRFDGIEYQYMMYKGEDKNHIDLISEKPTTERNGTTFNLRINNWSDRSLFVDKAQTQLAYFEKVYFNCNAISNGFKIIKGDDWKFSTLVREQNMHLCLDNVYYPIDWNILGIPPIQFNVGLDFKISDGLIPIPSREDIRYTPSVIAMIKEKIAKVANSFVEKYNESVTEKDSFLEIIGSFGPKYIHLTESRTYSLNAISSFSNIPIKEPSLKDIKHINLSRLVTMKHHMFGNYTNNYSIVNSRFRNKVFGHLDYMITYLNNPHNTTKYILLEEEIPKGVKLDYVKKLYPNAIFFHKTKDKKLGSLSTIYGGEHTYIYILDLHNQPRELWREIIKEYQTIEKSILDKVIKYKDLEPTPEFIAERKANRLIGKRTQVNKESINPKWGMNNSYVVTFISQGVMLVRDLHKTKGLVVYGEEEDKLKLQKLHSIKGLKAVMLPARDVKRLEKQNIHNWIKLDKFMEGNNQLFKRTATSFLIEKLTITERRIFRLKDSIKDLSQDFGNKLEIIENYYKANENKHVNSELKEEIIKVAKEHNLFDTNIYDIYKEVSEKIGIFDFLHAFQILSGYQADSLSTLQETISVEILKGRGFKLNAKHYKQPVEEAVQDTELIEATIMGMEDVEPEEELIEVENEELFTI